MRLSLRRYAVTAQVIFVAAVLCLPFRNESLWTDEAFTAYIACQRSFAALWHSLQIGSSADIQMWLYYAYVHGWISIFGNSELALRSANIPFIVLFAINLAWIRYRFLTSNWVWIGALSPVLWTYSSDARPYLIMFVLSTLFFSCVVAALVKDELSNEWPLSWVGLGALLIGINMDMLTGLIVGPALVFALVYIKSTDCGKEALARWRRALLVLSPPYLWSIGFFGWTFLRGAAYDYAPPEFMSIIAALFRLAGLGGYTPNRHYDISFRPYLVSMLSASVVLVAGGIVCLYPALRKRQPLAVALFAACVGAVFEVVLVTYGMRQQPETRHLISLAPLLVFLLFAGWNARRQEPRIVLVSSVLVASVWLISDVRLAFLPEFAREDFRSAVAEVLKLAGQAPAKVAIVADPAAVAYYGLAVQGPAPCFPLTVSCHDALKQVDWPVRTTGSEQVENAVFWQPRRIEEWLGNREVRHIVLISRSRHPLYLKSVWWDILQRAHAGDPVRLHGFFVYAF